MKNLKKLTILHSNDMHGDFLAEQIDERLVGGVSLLSGYVNKVRREEKNVIYAVAGDMFRGSVIDSEYKGTSTIGIMNLVGPDVATIGNHDSLNPDYTYHFNNPNATENGKTQAGGDYYYSYGAGLFIVLNTNNYNVAEHEKTIQEAIASAPDAAWRVVTIHQDIYGTGLDHSDTDGMILRTQLTPIFDKYDIDVVLQGHDHTYSRSKLLYGDGQTHGTV